MQTRLLNAITALLLAVGGAAAQDINLTGNLTPTKASYIKGGPIELLLTVTNGLPIAVSIDSPYPTFPPRGGITITPAAAKGRGSLRRDGPTLIEVAFASRRLAAGETCSYKVYLQRYMADLDVGAHSLAYSIDIPARRTDDGRWISVKGEGALEIGVFAGTDAELNETLAAYAAQLAAADFAESNFWPTRAAEEALAVTPSPLVIPYLKTLFEIGSTRHDVSPLSKFRGNEQAEDLLLSIVRGDKGKPPGLGGLHLATALSVLEDWQYVLTREDFAALCALPDTGFKGRLLQYAEKMNRAAYLPAVETLTSSTTPGVADLAARVAQELRDNGQWAEAVASLFGRCAPRLMPFGGTPRGRRSETDSPGRDVVPVSGERAREQLSR